MGSIDLNLEFDLKDKSKPYIRYDAVHNFSINNYSIVTCIFLWEKLRKYVIAVDGDYTIDDETKLTPSNSNFSASIKPISFVVS